MIDKNVEFVNAFSVYLEGEKTGDKYNDYLNACAKMGINSAGEDVDKMIVLDYLIRNTDRHVGNFGILRNSETLKWEKIAPVFDNGNSLWHNAQGVQFIDGNSKSECRSFTGENEKNVLLAGSADWYNKNKLNDIDKVITGILKHNKYIENERVDKIINEFKKGVTIWILYWNEAWKKNTDDNNINIIIKVKGSLPAYPFLKRTIWIFIILKI